MPIYYQDGKPNLESDISSKIELKYRYLNRPILDGFFIKKNEVQTTNERTI